MRGGFCKSISAPIRSMSDDFAPTPSAIRAAGTICQLRQTNACKRLGKCGNGMGSGALPAGNTISDTGDFELFFRAVEQPSKRPPAVNADAPRNFRRVTSNGYFMPFAETDRDCW